MKGVIIMTVYVVMHGVNYEGENFIGVYSTMEKAKNKIAEIIREDLCWNNITEKQIKDWLQTKNNTFYVYDDEYYYVLTERVDKD